MSSQKTIVAYLSKDRYNTVFVKDHVLYAEITPLKGVLKWPDPPPIPFSQFLGYYTQEEFEKYYGEK